MSISDLKTSVLIETQIPEFVRDDHPKFVAFVKAYYEFLETQANTSATSNNLISTAKSLRDIRDVDESIEKFERSFYNTFATLIPVEVQSNKALLFKHLANIYRSKGAESSFKLLFQLIYGKDIEVLYPRNSILRASASKWEVDSKLRINNDVFSRYVADGTTRVFYLVGKIEPEEINVYVDDVLKTIDVDYYINKEYRQLVFLNIPANNSIVKVRYENLNPIVLGNRKVVGVSSGAYAIIEDAIRRTSSDTFTLSLPIDLLINPNTLRGSFLNGEEVSIPIVDEVNNVIVDVRASTYSIVKKINVVDSGNNYSVGDLVYVYGGNSKTNAIGTVESVSSGFADSVLIHHGGAGFTTTSPISVTGNSAFTVFTLFVDAIDASGANAGNTLTVSPDVISNLSLNVGGNVYINSSNFGAVFLKSNVSAANALNTVFNYVTLQVGPISNVAVLSSTLPLNQKDSTVLDASGALYGANAPYRFSKSLKSIDRYRIIDGGLNYKIGDEVIFGPNPLGTYGQHAAATVGKIAANGYIQKIVSANARIQGTANILSACNEIIGTGTFFTKELFVGDTVEINNEPKLIVAIVTDTLATVSGTFTYSTSDRKIGVQNRWPIGGYGYTQNNFPSISVDSSTGSGAIIQVDSLLGDNERLSVAGFGASNGAITSIQVIDPGSGYQYIPSVSITGGDGSATGNVEIERTYISSGGNWKTTDSLLSSFERKIQGEDFYVDYSYVISSQIEFSKYKSLLKQLLHPVGLINYAFYNKQNIVELTDVEVERNKETTLSGKVNVSNGGAIVVGSNTKFNVLYDTGILTIGSSIAANGELRKVSHIVSNTKIVTESNVSNLRIANVGSGYSNGYLVFSNGGGQVTSLTISNPGSGYENGSIVFSGTDESIRSVANVEVHASNGALRNITFVSGGLYSDKPIALPDTNPHRVLYANGITITNRGQGYSNGWLQISGGSPLRDANVQLIVHPNTSINTVVIIDSGLYQTDPTLAVPNSSPNVVLSDIKVVTLVRMVDVNAHSRTVNSFITFTTNTVSNANVGTQYSAANARVYVNTEGYVLNVEVQANGAYSTDYPIFANIAGLRYYENNEVFTATTNAESNVMFTITAPSGGLGHSNGIINFSGGSPSRSAVASIEVFHPNSAQVISITANSFAHGANGYINFVSPDKDNISANARVFVNSTGAIVNVTVLNRGLYKTTPFALPQTGNAVFTVQMMPVGGKIRKIDITDNGVYSTAPTAVSNTTPQSIISVVSNTATNIYAGTCIANGYLVFGGGIPVRKANATYQIYPANGVINMHSVVITDVGLYSVPPITVTPNVTPVSVTQVLIISGGEGYLQPVADKEAGYVVFSTNQQSANNPANCLIGVDASGRINKTVVTDIGLYANGQDIIIVGILDPTTGAIQTPTTPAILSIGYNANTKNVAQLTVSSSANSGQTAGFLVTANSNTFVNAAFTLSAVANASTNAVITVGFVEQNTAANVLVEVYSGNGAIRKLTVNSDSVLQGVGKYYYTPKITPNSAGANAIITIDPVSWSQTANAQTAVIFSAVPKIYLTAENGEIIETEQEFDLIIE